MRYALLICDDESVEVSPEERSERFGAFAAFADRMGARGVLLGDGRLRPTATATTVRVRNGEVVIADGPFAETKEQIAGFFIVDCEDLDEAIEVAAQIPTAQSGRIEVRPVWDLGPAVAPVDDSEGRSVTAGHEAATSYTTRVEIGAPRERVFEALTTLEGLAGWWTPQVSGSPSVGGELTFGFGGDWAVVRVDRADAPSAVVWTCRLHSRFPEWQGNDVAVRCSRRAR